MIRFGLNIGKPWVAESEVAPVSDSKPEKPGCRVRSCTGFGLCTANFCILCPKMLQVRTLKLDFHFLCPKLPRIRTLNPRFSLFVSEVVPSSDSEPRIFTFCVRSCPRFGLCTVNFCILCPKMLQVQTLRSPNFRILCPRQHQVPAHSPEICPQSAFQSTNSIK